MTEPIETPEPIVTNTISFEDFAKVDLRIGTIFSAEKVPKSSKLLKLEVSFGPIGNRIILAGVGESFDTAALIGRQIMAVLNLAPRKMMGIESHGMLLACKRPDGVLALMMPSACVDPGSEVG